MLPLLALALLLADPKPVEVYDLVELPAAAAVTFTHADGTAVTAAAFDDGGTTKVRFMPTKPGAWTHPGGTLTAVNARRKGPIRVDPAHPHHFVWAGTGEHAFVSGTTAYWLLGVQDDGKITAAIDRLAKNKVNRIRVAVNARTTGGERWFEPQVKTSDAFKFQIDPWVNTNPGDPKRPKFDLARFNVPLWQKLDRLVRHARDKDVLVSVVFHLDGADDGVDPFGGGKAGLKTYAGSDAEWAYYCYAAARLSAFSNVMWDLTNEWHLFRSKEWVENAGKVLRAADPYRHLLSVHGRDDYPFTASAWSDFALYQSWDDAGAYGFIRKVRAAGDRVRAMPHVNEEYGYEDHYPGPWGGGKTAPARAAANRVGLAWEMAMAGGYQTTGERADVPGQGGWLTGLGDDSMKLPELHKHLADFFTSFDWWRCDPVDKTGNGVAHVLADAGRKTVALYCNSPPPGLPGPTALPPGEYVGRRFDPLTGKWAEPVPVAGEWPVEHNYPWAVLLEAKSVVQARDDLLDAARRGDLAAVTKLLDAGTSPNSRSEYGATPLHFAADKGHVEVVKLLLARGADPAAVDTFYAATPLTWARMRDQTATLAAFAAAGVKGATPVKKPAAKPDEVKTAPKKPADETKTAKDVTDPAPDVKSPANWPQFRGPGATGVADGQLPPTTFDVPKGQHVRWKTAIPGLGHSCPVVWGDRVFVSTAVGDPTATLRPGQYGDVDSVKEDRPHEFRVLCLDKNTGNVLWDKLAHTGVPAVKRHLKGTHANPTAATDGTHLVVSFGAEGLFCYGLDGTLKWQRSLGKLDSGWFFDPDYQWGFGSSPAVHDGRAFVQVDAGKTSFLAAFNLSDGSEAWRTDRAEVPSWGSPTVCVGPARTEVVCNGTKFARGYDPATGKELWRVGRLSEITVPTPFLAEGRIFVASGYRPVMPIFAVEPGASGDLTPKGDDKPKGLAWFAKSGGPYLPTPLAYRGGLYVLSNGGMLTRYDAATGQKGYSERVGGGSGYTAALVAADGRLYCTSETDGVRVVKAGPEFELLAVNPVGETCLATPAVSDGALFLRTERHLLSLSLRK